MHGASRRRRRRDRLLKRRATVQKRRRGEETRGHIDALRSMVSELDAARCEDDVIRVQCAALLRGLPPKLEHVARVNTAMISTNPRKELRGVLEAFAGELVPKPRGAEQKDADVTVIGVWDDCIPAYLVPAYCHSAWMFWARQGGDRSVAKSAWIDRDATPMSDLEGLALSVLRSHLVPGCEETIAGAEYWVQWRMGGGPGLGLHFDKDERAHAERDEWHHPMLATATYLTDGGAPLVVFNTSSDGEGPVSRGCLVAPRKARHVAFLGNLLHGVPRELTPRRDVRASEKRVSVLVNLWEKRPDGLERAPADPEYHPGEQPEYYERSAFESLADPFFREGANDEEYLARNLLYQRLNECPEKQLRFARVARDGDDYRLAEHRDGDTGPIPLEKWRRCAKGPAAALELRYY